MNYQDNCEVTMRKRILLLICVMSGVALFSGCGNNEEKVPEHEIIEYNNYKNDDKTGTNILELDLEDGEYTIEATLSGGSGRASVQSPASLNISNGEAVVEIKWSSPYYDYMIVNNEKYLPVNTEGDSAFVIPIEIVDGDISIIADTTAMSEPHEIEYTISFSSDTIKKVE